MGPVNWIHALRRETFLRGCCSSAPFTPLAYSKLSIAMTGSQPPRRAWHDCSDPLYIVCLPKTPANSLLFQDDPSAPHKIQDPLKSRLKEEESFNIQNSMSPKLEGGKGDQDDLGVNCLQNNLT